MTHSFSTAAHSDDRRSTPQPATPRSRDLLWVVLVVSAVGNSVASVVNAALPVHLALGTVAALCIAALVGQKLRDRQ